ncbi:bacteriocin-like protein [Chryseobacterium sp. Mn2064]|uniref:bacteriocin-like protein n=1 Tax=Chryseobacterium sp. Mn2064 TaxID=3395263 RepID=UPI003BE4F10C
MKKVLTSKKLSRNNLKAIQGAGQMVCCAVSCGDPSQCIFWEQLPAECPDLPYCL